MEQVIGFKMNVNILLLNFKSIELEMYKWIRVPTIWKCEITGFLPTKYMWCYVVYVVCVYVYVVYVVYMVRACTHPHTDTPENFQASFSHKTMIIIIIFIIILGYFFNCHKSH